MKRPSWRRLATAFAVLTLGLFLPRDVAVAQHHRNHSFDLDPASAVVCLDGATFDGEPTDADALNLLMTGEVWNADGTVQIAVGDTHTFTMVGEVYTFTVPYPVGTFNVGDLMTLSVTDVPGTFFGPQGDVATANVGDCFFEEPVPAVPPWGLSLLALVLVAGGAWLAARRNRRFATGFGAGLLAVLLAASPAAAGAAPTFSKFFDSDTIGPGSASILTFVITNPDSSPVTDLAFTDTLPAGVTIADPAVASTTCGGPPTLSAPAGGTTITFADGTLGAMSSCTVKVSVTSATPGTHMNVSGDLTSSAGNSGSSDDDLTVTTGLPGFTKVFSPSTVALGGRSTLTFVIDNTANSSPVEILDFTDLLPGMVIADPANALTDCGTAPLAPTLTATAGTSSISFSYFGSPLVPGVGAFDSCVVVVDVKTTGGGALDNLSSELSADGVFAGRATDTLISTATTLGIQKSFLDDPVPPGGTVTLEFRIDNRDRDFSATGIGFTDDLKFTASMGVVATGGPTPDPPCGAGSTLTGTDVLTLAGGTLPPGGSCTFSVTLSIPAGETLGAFVNTSSAVTGTVDGSPVVGNAASETLYVSPAPKLEKEFLDATTDAPDPVVAAGDDVKIRFKVTNTSSTSGATDITFQDPLTDILGFPVSATLPTTPCGAGSSMSLVSCGFDCQALELADGSLAASGMCTFDVTVTLPATLAAGTYLNTTGPISATVDGGTRIGSPASDTLDVVAAPQLSKGFIGSPAVPGGQVTLEFTLKHDLGAPGDATGITFTDDLTSTGITGLAAAAGELPLTDACGPGNGTLSGSAGDTLLTFSGGTLAPGEVCTFSLLLDVPASAPGGTHTNTASGVSATVDGIAVTSPAATGDLVVAQVVFTKEFTDDPALPFGTAILEFSLTNLSTDVVTDIFFSDNLAATLSGMTASSLPATPCGAGSTMIGTSSIFLIGGSLAAAGSPGDSCTFSVTLDIPGGAVDGLYPNATSNLSATVGATPTTLPPATDTLVVDSDLLFLQKSFIDDPVAPGDTVTLRFTIDNQDPDDPISAIAFSDDLDAVVPGLLAVGLPFGACGGTVSTPDGGMTVELAGGSLAAGGSCFFDVTVQVPAGAAGGTPLNTTSTISGTLGGLPVSGGPASDVLRISNLEFSKAFDGPTTPGGSPKLTFTIVNTSASAAALDLGFTDDLGLTLSGLEATSLPTAPCGAGSSITGTSFLVFSGGSLPPGGTCSIEVTLSVPFGATPGTYPNSTSSLTRDGLPVADPATDDLVVDPLPAVLLEKAFDGPTVLGGSVDLTFTLTNTSAVHGVTALAFTDDLGLTLPGLTATSLPPAPCGAGSSIAGTTVLSFSGGSLPPSGVCSFDVTLAVPAAGPPGIHPNTTSTLTSGGIEVGAAATDDLIVVPPPLFSKVFSPDTIGVTFETTLTFTIDNSASALPATGLAFTDLLPFDLELAADPMATNTCGGALTADPSGVFVDLLGGSVGAGDTCTISVKVLAVSEGSFVNVTGDLTSSLGNSGSAVDTLTVAPCLAANGINLTIAGEVFLVPATREVCNTISVEEHTLVLGPNGVLTLRAGVAVIFPASGFAVEQGGGLIVIIDPSLIP